MKGSLLFVYGTMLQKGRNHSRLYEGQAVFLGEVDTIHRFSMYVLDRNGAPIAIRDEDAGHAIRGELYAVPDEYIETVIDPVEGHPDIYRRDKVLIERTPWCPAMEVEMYTYPHEPGPNDRKVLPKKRVLTYD